MRTIDRITYLANGKGIRFEFQDKTQTILAASVAISTETYPPQTYVDLSTALVILGLHERIEKLENLVASLTSKE